MSGNDKHFDRRSVLKSIGATAVVGSGLSLASTSAAGQKADQIAQNYDEHRLRFAFDQHGDGVRQTLVDEGFVAEDFDFGDLAFDIDESVSGLHPKSEDRLAGVSGFVLEGRPTALGVVSTSSDTHEISLYVQPERDEAYAFVEPKDSDERFIVTDSDVSPQGCSYDECQSDCCSSTTQLRYIYNCNEYCEDCYVYDEDCQCTC